MHQHEQTERKTVAPRVALYGGSFNPPHIAHVLVASWALGLGEIDEVWVIPTGDHPFGKQLADFDDRLEMCRRAFGCFGSRVRLLEIERGPGPHYSHETVAKLHAKYPGYRWRWLMGSDTLRDAPKWRNFAELEQLAPPLWIPRAGYPLPEDEAGSPKPDFMLPNLSSTLVREQLAAGRHDALEGFVPIPVLHYITQRGLYGKP